MLGDLDEGHKTPDALLTGIALAATAAYAAIQITVNTPVAHSDGSFGDKPKIQRAGDGRLVVAYGDDTAGAGDVYDVKADVERPVRRVRISAWSAAPLS